MSDADAPGRLRLTVAVPTFKRIALLRRGLDEISRQVEAVNADAAIAVEADVLVVDNDAAASAATVADEFAERTVRYVVEPEPGIIAARNRALDECSDRDLLVFIDDDELPRSEWLTPLLATYRRTGAAAVSGRVFSVYDHGTVEPWVAAGDLFVRPRAATDTEVEIVATGNLLLDLGQLRELGVRFDPRLGLAGGEDTLLSLELRRRGARLVFCDDSVADDFVVPERLTRQWLLKRAISIGNTTATVPVLAAQTPAQRGRARLVGFSRGLVRIGGGGARMVVGQLTRSLRHQARGQRTMYRGLGMVAGAFGHRVEEYRRHPSTDGGPLARLRRTAVRR